MYSKVKYKENSTAEIMIKPNAAKKTNPDVNILLNAKNELKRLGQVYMQHISPSLGIGSQSSRTSLKQTNNVVSKKNKSKTLKHRTISKEKSRMIFNSSQRK